MTRTAARPPVNHRSTAKKKDRDADLDAWVFGEPEIGADGVALLAAYRDAEAAAKPAAAETATGEPSAAEGSAAPAGDRGGAGVPRLHAVDGIESDGLAAAHGRLVAAGYLTVDLLGRADGLAYRLTREGRRRLAGAPANDDEPLAEAA